MHNATTVDLDRFFRYIQFPGDLLVQHAGYHIGHDLVLKSGKRFDFFSDDMEFFIAVELINSINS